MIQIKYGLIDNNIDITDIVFSKMTKQNISFIPKNDVSRANIFSDPLLNILKSVFIINDKHVITKYDHTTNIYIDISNYTIYTDDDVPEYIQHIWPDIHSKLIKIQKNLKINFGSFNDEFPEQLMAARYLTGNEKVLEIGGNIGRNSLIIGYILNQKQNSNFVTLECDSGISEQLTHNRDINNLNFFIENSALSKRKLIQKGWDTIVSNELLPGYKHVNTITLEELYNKYNIKFDTLVLDCEGAFYYILMDMPEILENINLIIIENDFKELSHKQYVDSILTQHNFIVDYSETLTTEWWGPICSKNFFEVWKK
jgi:FkbM family methyltransferase